MLCERDLCRFPVAGTGGIIGAVGVTSPNVKNRTFSTVTKTCRHPEAKCNTFLQREIQAFSVESRFVAKTLVSAILGTVPLYD